MPTIDYDRLKRVLTRCGEVAAEPGMKDSVTLVYADVLKVPAQTYFDVCTTFTNAASAYAKENKESLDALDAFDGIYREARSVASAYVYGIKLPLTLRSQPTDTDQLNAIDDLLDIFHDHAGQPWADKALAGEFGTKGPQTIKEINDGIAANVALSEARTARAAAYGPAYEAYLKFKHVVRDALGGKSKQYHRIHLRDSPSEAQTQPATAPATTPANGATTTPANGAATAPEPTQPAKTTP